MKLLCNDGCNDVLAWEVIIQEHRKLLEQARLVQDADGHQDAEKEKDPGSVVVQSH